MSNQSEVARLLQQFALEQESAQQALYGFAQVGKHEIIEPGWDKSKKNWAN